MVLREKTGLPAHRTRAHPAAEMGGEEEGQRGDGRQKGEVAQVAGGLLDGASTGFLWARRVDSSLL